MGFEESAIEFENMRIFRGPRNTDFTRIISTAFTSFESEEQERAVRQLVTECLANGERLFWFDLGPSEDTAVAMKRLGFASLASRSWRAMSKIPAEGPSPQVEVAGALIENVSNVEQLDQWLKVVECCFPTHQDRWLATESRLREALMSKVPEKHHLLLTLNGAAAAACELFIEGDTASLHWVGVVPMFRGRGLAQLLIKTAESMASRQGCYRVHVQSTVEGLPTYTNLDFEDLGEIKVGIRSS